MARTASRPGRTLIIFALAVLAMYVGLAANGVWQPKLGLDLQGGTRITLAASTATGEAITQDKMVQAVEIIDSRVNASGVSESEVAKQGDRNIVVEIPGDNRDDLVETVQQQAQLRFRLVAGQPLNGTPNTLPLPVPASPEAGAAEGATPQGRAVSEGLQRASGATNPSPDAGDEAPGDTPGDAPGDAPGAEAPADPAAPTRVTDDSSIQELRAWARSPDPRWAERFEQFTCAQADEIADDPSRPLLACDEDGAKYLLTPAIIEGTQLNDASYGIPQGQAQYVVDLDFNGDATETFADVTRRLAGSPDELFAIVLDGVVLSAPRVTSPIVDGNAQISGDFTADSARSLANSLKYGALPLQFEVQEVAEEGPTLAEDQLSAGLWAGGLGLLLVLAYCMFYYRGLGLVVLASLLIAAATTYAAVLALSETAGFTLTLPGIAGLIVAVGITADSFIVYFERLRDELREGKSLRVAVETGWVRARATCLAADAVSLLAAVVLYIFAIGVVKGFAFALGISTLIDLLVFFLFTKPMVTWLARYPFFYKGHRLSGLSPEHVGVERLGRPAMAPAGVRRTAEGATR
jgi:preprotein translocase subunit SecD